MIVYDTQTTILTRQQHGMTGVLRSGASQGLRNYTTFVSLYSPRKLKTQDAALWDVSDILSKRQSPLDYGLPEVYEFTIGRGNLQRNVAAIHGLLDVKVGYRFQQEYRFVVVFRHEISDTLRREFKARDAARDYAKGQLAG